MRLLLPGRKEGIPRFILETTKRLVENRPNDNFYFIFDRNYDKDLIFSDNIIPVVIGPQARHPWLWYWWFEHSLPKVFKRYKIDLFYSPEMYISLKANVPTLMVSHDIVFETFPDHLPSYQQRYLVKNIPKFHRKADHIITVSNFGKEDIIEKYQIDASKISVAGNACPDGFVPVGEQTKERIKDQYSASSPFIIYVGAIHPRKNVLRMIEAFKQFKASNKSDLKFVVVGRMAWKSKEVAEAIYKTEDVIYLDNIGDELKEIVASSEALFFASLFEGFGIPILEGMKSAVPVITSNINAMKEVAGEAGLLVDPYSIDDMSQAISKVINDKNFSRELVEKGIKREKDFNWDDTALHVEEKLFNLI